MMKHYVVVLSRVNGRPVYLGELDPGVRQGVRSVDHAVRFTVRGAARVARAYPGATVECV
jgi:hypothetical protein